MSDREMVDELLADMVKPVEQEWLDWFDANPGQLPPCGFDPEGLRK